MISSGGFGILSGSASLLSAGDKLLLSIEYDDLSRMPEQIAFDGNEVRLGDLNDAYPEDRSYLDTLFGLRAHSRELDRSGEHRIRKPDLRRIIKEGLLGGTLSTAWPFLNLKSSKPKLKSKGLKTVNGQQLLELEYKPKKSWGNLEGRLYFDPESFHHIASIYKGTIYSNMGKRLGRAVLEEWFGVFQTRDGLSLPTHWKIKVTIKIGKAKYAEKEEWDIIFSKISHNLKIDPQRFVLP